MRLKISHSTRYHFDNPVGYVLRLGEFGLTMGQILSLPMVILGIWLIAQSRSVMRQ